MDEKTRRFKRVEKLFTPEPDLVAVEELADLITSRPVRSRIQERLRPTPEPEAPVLEPVAEPTLKQVVVDKDDYPVRRQYMVINSKHPGQLIEVMLRSPSDDFAIFWKRDTDERHNTYAELSVWQEFSKMIDAFQDYDTRLYCVNFREFRWDYRFVFQIYCSNITFTKVWAVWEELR